MDLDVIERALFDLAYRLSQPDPPKSAADRRDGSEEIFTYSLDDRARLLHYLVLALRDPKRAMDLRVIAELLR